MQPKAAEYMKNFKIWLLFTKNSFEQLLLNRGLMVIFIFGKLARLGMFLFFLSLLFRGITSLGGYTASQIFFFYLAFNFIDSTAQFFLREVYRFRSLVVSGDLDLVLVKPFNPLVKVLFGGADLMDLFMLVLITTLMIYVGVTGVTLNLFSWLGFFVLVLNALLIAVAFHIVVLAIGVVTLSVDHIVMIYRDLTALMRIPVDLYVQPLRSLLTFVIPLGIMFTFPPKFLMGLLSPSLILVSLGVAVLSVYLSLWLWHSSLRHYQSASS
jgi:ABC-2 type transport system permease protein